MYFQKSLQTKLMDDIITNLKNVREALLTENEETDARKHRKSK